MYVHISRIIDCLSINQVFVYEKDGIIFNFRNYYNESQRIPIDELKKIVAKKLSII